jgi:hypothetical protein
MSCALTPCLSMGLSIPLLIGFSRGSWGFDRLSLTKARCHPEPVEGWNLQPLIFLPCFLNLIHILQSVTKTFSWKNFSPPFSSHYLLHLLMAKHSRGAAILRLSSTPTAPSVIMTVASLLSRWWIIKARIWTPTASPTMWPPRRCRPGLPMRTTAGLPTSACCLRSTSWK